MFGSGTSTLTLTTGGDDDGTGECVPAEVIEVAGVLVSVPDVAENGEATLSEPHPHVTITITEVSATTRIRIGRPNTVISSAGTSACPLWSGLASDEQPVRVSCDGCCARRSGVNRKALRRWLASAV